tara:strand:- start:2068 stop:2496 length:429 start_codon:yes stop_codon:yes gene_type:complete
MSVSIESLHAPVADFGVSAFVTLGDETGVGWGKGISARRYPDLENTAAILPSTELRSVHATSATWELRQSVSVFNSGAGSQKAPNPGRSTRATRAAVCEGIVGIGRRRVCFSAEVISDTIAIALTTERDDGRPTRQFFHTVV